MAQESVYVRELDQYWWEKIEEIAKDLGISRSKMVMIAVKEFVKTYEGGETEFVDNDLRKLLKDL